MCLIDEDFFHYLSIFILTKPIRIQHLWIEKILETTFCDLHDQGVFIKVCFFQGNSSALFLEISPIRVFGLPHVHQAVIIVYDPQQ